MGVKVEQAASLLKKTLMKRESAGWQPAVLLPPITDRLHIIVSQKGGFFLSPYMKDIPLPPFHPRIQDYFNHCSLPLSALIMLGFNVYVVYFFIPAFNR